MALDFFFKNFCHKSRWPPLEKRLFFKAELGLDQRLSLQTCKLTCKFKLDKQMVLELFFKNFWQKSRWPPLEKKLLFQTVLGLYQRLAVDLQIDLQIQVGQTDGIGNSNSSRISGKKSDSLHLKKGCFFRPCQASIRGLLQTCKLTCKFFKLNKQDDIGILFQEFLAKKQMASTSKKAVFSATFGLNQRLLQICRY